MRATTAAIMPNYNHGHLITAAIAGLRAQTRPYDEIIVVDDGSTDDSIAIITRLAGSEPRLRLIRHARNQGAVAAMNTGLAAAQADLVHFAAADDAFRPALVATLAPLLEARPNVAFASAEVALVRAEDGTPVGQRPPVRPAGRARCFTPAEVAALLRRIDNIFLTQAALFRRTAVQGAGGFDAALGSFCDGVLARRLALTQGFCFVPTVLAEWRVAEAGYSRSLSRDAARAEAALAAVRRDLQRDTAFPAWYPALFERRWRFATARLAVQADPVDTAVLRAMLGGSPPWLPPLLRLPRALRNPLLLAALTLRFRPTSLVGLATTALSRRAARLEDRPA
jgi:glycosyltransferase involved in cell wall biosynthesis